MRGGMPIAGRPMPPFIRWPPCMPCACSGMEGCGGASLSGSLRGILGMSHTGCHRTAGARGRSTLQPSISSCELGTRMSAMAQDGRERTASSCAASHDQKSSS
eukprot:scaffold14672_cov145-Isochrysis_galbana.AAC.1